MKEGRKKEKKDQLNAKKYQIMMFFKLRHALRREIKLIFQIV